MTTNDVADLIFRRIRNSSCQDDQSGQVVSDQKDERPIADEGRNGRLSRQGRNGGGRGLGALLVDLDFGLLEDGRHEEIVAIGDSCRGHDKMLDKIFFVIFNYSLFW